MPDSVVALIQDYWSIEVRYADRTGLKQIWP
jgi:hypothetical protein